jgi:hypothetical protein
MQISMQLNSDFNSTPALFSGVAANGNHVCFRNSKQKSTTKKSWGTRDAMKKTKQGGLDPLQQLN